jgi:hypothetical protein
VRLIQYRLDFPNLRCDLCERLYNQGDLATLPCTLCPVHIMPEPDEITLLANQIYGYLANSLFPEHPPDLIFLFQLVGLQVGSEKSRQVYDRLLTRVMIEREHRHSRDGHGDANGQPAANSS